MGMRSGPIKFVRIIMKSAFQGVWIEGFHCTFKLSGTTFTVGGAGGMLPQKIFDFRLPEIDSGVF